MIDSKILKLICNIHPTRDSRGYTANKDDVRIGLELLRKQFYPEIPAELKTILYTKVRSDVVDEYLDHEDSDLGSEDWKCKWKNYDT